MAGDLYLVGGGDPVLGTEPYVPAAAAQVTYPQPYVTPLEALADQIVAGIEAYVADVRASTFPADTHTYRMFNGELPAFQNALNEPSDT